MIVLGFALRLLQLDQQSLWFDEIVIISIAKLPLLEGLDSLLQQGIQLTPLDHWVIKLWLTVGDTDWLVRFPALFFGVLAIPLTYVLGRCMLNHRVGLFAAALVTINPFYIWYSQEARGYSLLAVAATGAMISFHSLLNGRNGWNTTRYIIFNMLGFGTHYFMLLLPTVQFLFIILQFKVYYPYFRKWVFIHVVSGTILLSWFWFVVTRGQFTVGTGWIPNPDLLDPLLTLWNFMLGYREEITPLVIVSLAVLALVLLLGIIYARRFKPLNQLLLIWLFVPLILVWLFSQGQRSFYVDRYFLVITSALFLLLAIGVTELASQPARLTLTVALFLVTLTGLSQIYLNRTYFSKDDWRGAANLLAQQAQPGDGLVTCTDGYRLALDYYDLGKLFRTQKQAGERYYLYPANFDFNVALEKYDRVWVVAYNPRKPQHHLGFSYSPELDPARLPAEMQTWLARNPPETAAVAGITAFRYDWNVQPDWNELVRWNCNTD